MKAIMISIQPQWVSKILSGEKTIEIRKTMPKCKLPCKVYIYCTKGRYDEYTPPLSDTNYEHAFGYVMNGKVVAEFTLNGVIKFNIKTIMALGVQQEFMQKSCLGGLSLRNYLGDRVGYAWYIDNLKIYDEPKDLNDFYSAKECSHKDWGDVDNIGCWECGCEMFSRGECRFGHLKLDRPPQSWCYVEELENE